MVAISKIPPNCILYFEIVHEMYKQKSVEQSKNVNYQDHENLIP